MLQIWGISNLWPPRTLVAECHQKLQYCHRVSSLISDFTLFYTTLSLSGNNCTLLHFTFTFWKQFFRQKIKI